MAELIYVVLADGFEEIEAVAPVDVLRRAGFGVFTVGLTEKQVRGSHGITITADKIFDEVRGTIPDVLVLPGGLPGAVNLGKHKKLKELAEKVCQNGGLLAAICAAPAFTLAEWELLNGKKAVCYPGCESDYLDKADWQNDDTGKNSIAGNGVAVDGKFITARGPGAALVFAFTIVRHLRGEDAAEKIMEQMQFIR